MELWAYFTDNSSTIFYVDNSPLFSFIQEGRLDDDHIFIDDIRGGREELGALLRLVNRGDVVMVRSLADLADNGAELVNILQEFEDRGTEVVSINEPWYDYKSSFEKLTGTIQILSEQAEKKRKLGMESAKAAGRMGRKATQGRREQLQRLRSAGMSVREITELCGISRSTYYRKMKK